MKKWLAALTVLVIMAAATPVSAQTILSKAASRSHLQTRRLHSAGTSGASCFPTHSEFLYT